MKQITTFFISLLLVGTVSAQSILFQKTYGGSGTDRAWSIAQTSDGGYIIAGETNSVGAGGNDAYLTKTDAYGTVQWTRVYGGSGFDWAYQVRETSDGGFIVIGGTESSGNGLGDIWIFKTTSLGIITWQRTCGSADGDSGNDIIQTSDGGYVAAGFQNDAGGTGDNACMLKLDASGNVQWIHTYSVGSNDEYAYSVAQTSSGGYLLAGESYDNINFFSNGLLINTDASGNVLWANTYGGTDDHWINTVTALPSGGCVIGGATYQTSSYDIWLAKLNPNGIPVWSNAYSAAGTGSDVCLWYSTTSDGGYALCGRSNSFSASYDAFMIKTDSTGAPEWSKRYGGTANDAANQIIQSSSGGYAIAASSISFGNGESAYFIKTDTSGVTGCNEGIPAFLMSNITSPVANVTVIDSSLTNAASSNILFTTQTLTENSLCFTVGENEIASAEDLISVYPNPVSESFTIDLRSIGSPAIEEVEIYSSLGEKIFGQKQTADSQQKKINVDTHSWSVGIYFVRVKSESGIVVKKLIKN